MIDIILFTAALAALAYTLLPYVWRGRTYAKVNLGAEDLFIAKERIYANIKDLDLDHEMGKVGDADYQAMRGHLKQEAAATIERIDRLHGGVGRAALEREIAQHRTASATACRKCGASLAAGSRFCPECGQAAS